VAARGAKILSYSITINGYDSITEEVLVTDEVDPGTEKARKELEERLEKRKEEKRAEEKKTEDKMEKERSSKDLVSDSDNELRIYSFDQKI
jgi:3-hydroxyacyl-CoA dehydrogenase